MIKGVKLLVQQASRRENRLLLDSRDEIPVTEQMGRIER